jgi:hypothetical protein
LTIKVSTYSFATHTKAVQIKLLDVYSGRTELLYEDNSYSEPTWIGDKDFVFFKSGDKGATSLMYGNAASPSA